jgi:hypothetical protein
MDKTAEVKRLDEARVQRAPWKNGDEYFHGITGTGLGASHQKGWTGLIASAMHLFATTTPEQALELGKIAAFTETAIKAREAKAAAVSGASQS